MIDLTPGAGPTILIPQQQAQPAALRQQDQVEAPRARRAQPDRNDPAWRQAVEFEAVFLSEMLSHMFTKTEADEPFGGGSAEQTWNGLMNQQYGKSLANSGGVGIARHVYDQILRLQEV
ncbi:MAG: rod-binding protein [Sneathiellaceae bacterium]